jgi:hypothetical protein
MTTETPQKGQVKWLGLLWLGLIALLALSGLCSIFALVVTAAEAWQEHAQARWPEVTARVDSCGLDQTSTGRRDRYHIHCRLSYAVGAEQNATNVYSRNVPSPEVSQYPPNQIVPFAEWVDEHPQGTPVVLRYDPANHTNVVLAANHMPFGGPRTRDNVKLLGAFAGSFLALLTIARITRPRSLWQSVSSATR